MTQEYTKEAARERECKLYDAIVEYKRAHDGNSPTLRELMAPANYASVSAVSNALGRLEKQGLIKLIGKGKARRIEVVGARWTPPEFPRITVWDKNEQVVPITFEWYEVIDV